MHSEFPIMLRRQQYRQGGSKQLELNSTDDLKHSLIERSKYNVKNCKTRNLIINRWGKGGGGRKGGGRGEEGGRGRNGGGRGGGGGGCKMW